MRWLNISVYQSIYLSIRPLKVYSGSGRYGCFFLNVEKHPSLPVWELLFFQKNSNYFPLMSSCSCGCASPSSLLWEQQLQCWAWLAASTNLFPLTDCRLHSQTAGSQPPGAQLTRSHNTRTHRVLCIYRCAVCGRAICFNFMMTFHIAKNQYYSPISQNKICQNNICFTLTR